MDGTRFNAERLDYLPGEELKIIQSSEVFSFSMDAVLLAQFTYLPIQKGRVIDLCTGNGVIPLLLSKRTKAHIEAVEIQARLFNMAQRSVVLNQLDQQIIIHHMDLKDTPQTFGHGGFDVVTCNPPYMPIQTGMQHHNEHFAIARHEIMCCLEDVVLTASRLVKPGGRVSLVHRPHRLTDIITLMREYKVEPKRIRFVHPKQGKEANMLLIEGMKDGQPDLRLLPPLVVYNDDNEYTQELKQIYYRDMDRKQYIDRNEDEI
jgi:tRNA1(Val) A37 N6-methylase TrmN6